MQAIRFFHVSSEFQHGTLDLVEYCHQDTSVCFVTLTMTRLWFTSALKPPMSNILSTTHSDHSTPACGDGGSLGSLAVPQDASGANNNRMSPLQVTSCRFLVIASLLAMVTSTLSVYPHQLAYFNEVAGGPENGYKHLLHSNLDWGQDFLIVKAFHGSPDPYLFYHGAFDPAALNYSHSSPKNLFRNTQQGVSVTAGHGETIIVSVNCLYGVGRRIPCPDGTYFDLTLAQQALLKAMPMKNVAPSMRLLQVRRHPSRSRGIAVVDY